MKVLGRVTGEIRALVFDIDHTLYVRTNQYFEAGSRCEISALAEIFGEPAAAAAARINGRRQGLMVQLGRSVTLTETVYDLGITTKQWSDIRQVAWNPDSYIFPDSGVSQLMSSLAYRYQVAFATNSPLLIGRRILELIGILSARCFGPENLSCSKPDPNFFAAVAAQIGVEPRYCLSIGDREMSDGPPALAAGYAGAIIVPGSRDELLRVVPQLCNGQVSMLQKVEELRYAV